MTPERLKQMGLKDMEIGRYFTKHGKNPFEFDIFGNPIKWVEEDVNVTDDKGKVIFTQPNVSKPDFWSSLALKVVASKYFWGDQAKGERENSIENIIGRVARFFERQAINQGYYNSKKAAELRDELIAINLNQMAVFNSPVWFNAGIWEYNKNAGGVSAFKWEKNDDNIHKVVRGEDRPQCSACFIQGIEDNMESILALQTSEALIFRAGSGTGTNRSPLRSSKEKLTGGGRASGPVSYMKGYDAYANIIKSGGKTRRAAKMEILNVDHPDIMQFILAKQTEEKKAWALIEQGYSGGMNGDAYGSVFFQNCNMSVRATDNFMIAAKKNEEWQTRYIKTGEISETLKAKEVLDKIAEGTWICGDPGMQFDTIINKYHTCKASGRINASNPCVTGDTKVLLSDGRWARIDSIVDRDTTILTNTGIINKSDINGSFATGIKPVYRLTTKNGYEIKLTGDHMVFTINRGFVEAANLTKDDRLLIPASNVANIDEIEDKKFYQMLGVYLGDGSSGNVSSNSGIQLTMNKFEEKRILESFAEYVSSNYERATHQNFPAQVQITDTSAKYVITNSILQSRFKEILDLNLQSHQKVISDKLFNLSLSEQKYILQGLFTADGTVANYGEKSQYVALDSTSLQLLKDVQILLLGFGIKSKLYKNRRAGKLKSLLPDGKGGVKEYDVREVHSLRLSRDSRVKFERLIGFMPESLKSQKLKLMNENIETYRDLPFEKVNSLDFVGQEMVYDLTEPITHTFVANGITIHNCSEYMFLDDSACNLASINLMKFRTSDAGFDVEAFRKTVRTMIIAMELAVDGSSYPTEKIARNSHDYRPLGLGYANLGALLMSYGLPYDSDEGRAVAAAITAIMGGEAYKTSAELAALVGAFPGYSKNKESMLEVMNMHRDAVKKIDVVKMPSNLKNLVNDAWDSWTDAVEIGEIYGFRNSQSTVLAPTGTIAFMMDCDTTGIEPDIALVKYKVLSGGGMLKIVNRSVPLALRNLGYSENDIKNIVDYIDKNDTIEGSSLKDEHMSIFDCAFKPANGKRSIHYKGHIKMMAVTQPFLSGAISKTINMPENSTVSDIADAYIYSWELGLKAVAIYRENSKRSQPLNTQKTENEMIKKQKAEKLLGERLKLPQTRKSVTHKFDIAGHEGYITVGLYDDGKPGEVFVTMHKVGSTINGLVDAWATSVSLNLQYGIPVDVLFNKFRHQKFEPSGFVRNGNAGELDKDKPVIRTASSIVDYVSQFMLNSFGIGSQGAGKVEFEIKTIEQHKIKDEDQKSINDFSNEGLTCPHCGGAAKRMGNCAIYCTSCKQTTRSGCGE
jgi:ribonucleoside-diphosphate reductase alpha chain